MTKFVENFCYRPQKQTSKNPHPNFGVRFAEGDDLNSFGHRSSRSEGLERFAAVLHLILGLNLVGHFSAV